MPPKVSDLEADVNAFKADVSDFKASVNDRFDRLEQTVAAMRLEADQRQSAAEQTQTAADKKTDEMLAMLTALTRTTAAPDPHLTATATSLPASTLAAVTLPIVPFSLPASTLAVTTAPLTRPRHTNSQPHSFPITRPSATSLIPWGFPPSPPPVCLPHSPIPPPTHCLTTPEGLSISILWSTPRSNP